MGREAWDTRPRERNEGKKEDETTKEGGSKQGRDGSGRVVSLARPERRVKRPGHYCQIASVEPSAASSACRSSIHFWNASAVWIVTKPFMR